MKIAFVLMLAATSLCLFGCAEEKKAPETTKTATSASAAAAAPTPTASAKAADTAAGGW